MALRFGSTKLTSRCWNNNNQITTANGTTYTGNHTMNVADRRSIAAAAKVAYIPPGVRYDFLKSLPAADREIVYNNADMIVGNLRSEAARYRAS